MLNDLNANPVLDLFEKFRARYDQNARLVPPDGEVSVADLWQQLQKQMKLDQEELTSRIAELTELPATEGQLDVSVDLIARIPKKIAERHFVVPLVNDQADPVLAVANPLDQELREILTFIFGSHYSLCIASPRAIEVAISSAYEGRSEKEDDKAATNLDSVPKSEMDRAVPLLARQILAKSIQRNASDIHIQPFAGASIVRLRVDGRLQRLAVLPKRVAQALIRYFKARSEMDPTLSLVPQDGRMLVEIGANSYDLRLSSLPVVDRQEKMVIRLLNRKSILKLSEIGFSPDEIHTINRLAASPSGVILVCGPTGSGKSTTLYSILNRLNGEEKSIMTVENPVEYRLQGLSQTEVNEKAGMTFPRALKAILRQDPDVLLIGEIRDQETAEIALQSALTGHLVFSTLHTNDSFSALPRLMDLGADTTILADALTGIVSQRLLRKLCDHCKRPADAASPAASLFKSVTGTRAGYSAMGCEKCHFSGYDGRTVVAEVIEINPEQRQLLLDGEKDISRYKGSMKSAFNSLATSASRLIISGETSVEEAVSILGQRFWIELASDYGRDIPDMSGLFAESTSDDEKPLILTIGNKEELQPLNTRLEEEAWFSVVSAESPNEARDMLKANENTVMVTLDIPAKLSDEQAKGYVADYREHLAWARIPALIRLPPERMPLEKLLRADGATSRFVSTQTPADEIIEIIQVAVSKGLDFKWGLESANTESAEI